MRFVGLLFLFCIAVVGSVWLTHFALRDGIEKELESRSRKVLVDAGFPNVGISFDRLDGSISGTVDRSEDVEAVVKLLRKEVPTAYWPDAEHTGIKIRPTVPPRIVVSRAEDSVDIRVEGSLAEHESAGRLLLSSRLRTIPGVGNVDNGLGLDELRLPFSKMAELASIATGLLSEAGKARVSLEDNVLELEGTLPNEGLKTGILQLAKEMGLGNVVDKMEVMPAETFDRISEIKIMRNRFGLHVEGVYPDEEGRKEVVAALEKVTHKVSEGTEGGSVIHRIEIGENCGKAPWQDALPALLPVMLDQLIGEVSAIFLADKVLITGTVKDEATQRELLALLASLRSSDPPCEVTPDIGILASNSALSPELDAVYEGELLTLSGKLPDSDFAQNLEARLRVNIPELRIKNRLESIPKGPENEWTGKLADFFVDALGRLSVGKFVLSADEFILEGTTLALSDRQLVQNLAVNAVPASIRVQNRLVHSEQAFPRPNLLPQDRVKLQEALKALPIYFDKNSEVLKDSEKGKVSSIAVTVKETASAIELIVCGFADNIGNRDANAKLSLQRAQSVKQELIRLGLTEAQLSTESKEEDVSGIPQAGRWKSRRVEVYPKAPKSESSDQ